MIKTRFGFCFRARAGTEFPRTVTATSMVQWLVYVAPGVPTALATEWAALNLKPDNLDP